MDWCAAGPQAIEIFAARSTSTTPTANSTCKEIADWFQTSGISLHSVHSPMYTDYEWGRSGAPPINIAAIDRAQRIEAMDEIKRAIEIAEQIPFRFLMQHMGASGESFDDRKFEAAMTSIEHLRAFAKPLGVTHPAGEYSQRTLYAGASWWSLSRSRTSMTSASASTSATRTSWATCRRPSRS